MGAFKVEPGSYTRGTQTREVTHVYEQVRGIRYEIWVAYSERGGKRSCTQEAFLAWCDAKV